MMHFNIVCVGKIKEAYLQSAIADYVTRLSKYVKIDITDYIVNIANLNDIYNPGLVITCEKGQIILSTADSYYYPLILEVILDE